MRLLVTGASGFIGTHLLDAALERGFEVLNFDIAPPRKGAHRPFWQRVDIMQRDQLIRKTMDFGPNWVVHLAARTDCVESTTVEEGYRVNTVGVSNVIAAVKACDRAERVLMTSTQYVFNKGAELPRDEHDYHPVTVYGQSKVVGEKLTRNSDLGRTWAIVRPTNVWGPWHFRQAENFFFALSRGLYVHPGGPPVRRAYGYVRNVVHQMLALVGAEPKDVKGRTFYVGDEPIDLLDWVNAFSECLRGRRVRVAPYTFIQALGRVGDGISRVTGRPFLITTTRFQSMTRPYLVPMQPTFDLLGPSPVTLRQGVEETVEWLRSRN